MENPFRIVVYDRDLNFAGFVVDPVYAHFVPSWWNQGYGSFMLAADNPHSAALQAKGARITVQYRGQHLMSGPIRSRRGDLVANGTVTYQVLDDRRLLVNTLAFVKPSAPLETSSLTDLGQAWRPQGGSSNVGEVNGQTSYYFWPDGSAAAGGEVITSSEGAIKHLIRQDLVERLGRNVTILPDQGRGGDPTDILPIVRMETLAEAIQPILNFSGMSVKVWQPERGDTIMVDVVEQGVWDQALTPESGIIHSGVYALNAPDITRPIIGGPGETASRAFAGIEGTGNRTRDEVDYNDVIEVFSEASSFEFAWPEGLTDAQKVPKYYPHRAVAAEVTRFAEHFTKAIAKALKADPAAMYADPEDEPIPGPSVASLEMELSETETFHYGGDDGIQLGDTVTVETSGETFKNQVTECMLTFTRDSGLVVTPLVGQRQDDPDVELATALANVAKALRNISTSK